MSHDSMSLSELKAKKSLNEDEIIYRYELEQKVMDAIMSGDFEAIQSTVKKDNEELPHNPIVRRIPDNLLRDRKNGFIIRNTFCRIAAHKGGLPPVYVHLISETIALKIEQATSVEYLDNILSEEMIKDYCEAVKQFSTRNYSNLIKQVISYIANHVTDQLTLNDVAEIFHINGAHLSRKFKKETGFTFSHYVNLKRIEYAKLLFHEGHSNITEVANLVGFNSSSYFSKVFKKTTDTSPRGYLNELP